MYVNPFCAGQTGETVHNQFHQTLWRKKHRGRVKLRENDKCLDISVQVRLSSMS